VATSNTEFKQRGLTVGVKMGAKAKVVLQDNSFRLYINPLKIQKKRLFLLFLNQQHLLLLKSQVKRWEMKR
jgi:hypothetical protein